MKHPDYDIDFKPAIARYDWDQTYDVLEFVHLPQGFNELIQQVGIPAFELMAIDRFTPYRYLWAEQYSDYLFNFLKQFNFSPYADLTLQFTGYLGTTRTETKTTVLSKLNSLPRYNRLSSYPVSLSEGQYRATMLVYCHDQEGIVGNIPTINQTVVSFTLPESRCYDLNKLIKSVTENIDINYGDTPLIFCSNSLVIEKQVNGLWQGITVSPTAPFLMYSDITNYFSSASSLIVGEFSNIYDPSKVIDLFDLLLRHLCPLQSFPKKLVDNFTASPSSSNLEFTFQQFPDHMRDYCYLQRANNNKWGGNLYPDLGYIPSTHAPDTSFLPILYPVKPELITDSLGNGVFLNQDALFPIYPLAFVVEYGRKPDGDGNHYVKYSDDRENITSNSIINIGLGNAIQIRANAWLKWNTWNYAKKIAFNEYLISSGASTDLGSNTNRGRLYRRFINRFQEHNIADGSYIGILLREEEIIEPYPTIPRDIGVSTTVSLPTIEDTVVFFDIEPYTLTEWGEIIAQTEILEQDYLNYLLTTKAQLEGYMVDSVRLKEIHACLGAKEASYYTDSQGNPKEVVMNIARKLDLLCKWQGLNVKLNGEYQRTQSTKYFPPGRPIPPGWYYDRVGVNGGWNDDSEAPKPVGVLGIDDQRVGMAYPVRSNLGLETQDGLNIVKGGAVCCNNILQYLDTALDDLAKAIDWEEMGTGAITVGDKVFIYEGMLDILQEILFLVSDNNNNTEETKIAVGVTQQVSKEIMKAIGLAYGVKTFDYNIDGQGVPDTIEGRPVLKKSVQVPYPGTIYGAPTLVDILLAILANQGVANAGNISLKNEKLQEILNQQSNP